MCVLQRTEAGKAPLSKRRIARVATEDLFAGSVWRSITTWLAEGIAETPKPPMRI
jgi:hypothetical protein